MRMSKLYLPALTLAGALALAGCGGGGGPGISPERMAANDAIDAAIIAVRALDVTADDADEKVMAADALLEEAETAIADLPAERRAALMAMLSDADRIVVLAQDYLAARKMADDDVAEAQRLQGEAETAKENADNEIARLKKQIEDAEEAEETAEQTAASAAMAKAAKDLFGNLRHVGVSGGGIAGSSPDADSQDYADQALEDEITSAVNAIKDGKGTAASDDGEISVTVHRLGGKREKTATANSYTDAQLTENTDDDIRKAIMSSAFTGTGEPVTLFTGAGTNLIYRVAGSYNGAAGTYTCTTTAGQDCVARNTPDNGVYLGGDGAWTFAPSAGEKEYASAASVDFGYWLDSSNDNEAPASRRAGVWWDSARLAATAPGNARGTATYEGKAAGLAAIYSGLPGATGNLGGEFEADAALTADFGDDMLEGMITNFRIGDHSPDWTVELMESEMTGAATSGSPKTKWSIGADDPNAAESGGWRATVYYPAGTDSETLDHPSFVGGAFNSKYGGAGRMVGAFGAVKE